MKKLEPFGREMYDPVSSFHLVRLEVDFYFTQDEHRGAHGIDTPSHPPGYMRQALRSRRASQCTGPASKACVLACRVFLAETGILSRLASSVGTHASAAVFSSPIHVLFKNARAAFDEP